MNCERVQQHIILAQYGELPDDQSFGLEQHLDGCEDCRREWNALIALHEELALDPMVEPEPNLLAAARVRLDEALDAMPARSMQQSFLANVFRWRGFMAGAPALATLLLGVGFLGGTVITRYQAAHEPQLPRPVIMENGGQGAIASISGIERTPDNGLVTVKYNRLIPEQVQGSFDDPQIQQLLILGTKQATDNQVHAESVAMLSNGCADGHACDNGVVSGSGNVRETLLTSLQYDKNPETRLKALHGLQPYVAQDQRVRDVVLESLMHDGSAQVRTQAISMLSPVGADASVRQALRTVSTQDANPAIRNASFQALQDNSDIQ
jgi:hypothetical protein